MFCYFFKQDEQDFKNPILVLEPISCVYKFNEKSLEAEFPLDKEDRWKYIKTNEIIKADGQLYRINEVNTSLDSIYVYGKPIFFDLADTILLDKRPTDKNGQEALDDILKNTRFRGHSNINKINTAYYVRKNIVEALLSNDENSFLNRWGGEVLLDNFDIYINDKIGTDRGLRIDEGYNLASIEKTVDTSDVITRIIPEGYNGIVLDGSEPWVDSTLINNYPHPKMRVVKFDDIKVKENPDDKEGFNTLYLAQQEMIKRSQLMFSEQKVDEPYVNYKIDMIDLSTTNEYEKYENLLQLNIGDTVHCYISDLNIDVEARVVNYEKNLITGDYTRLELGNFKQDSFQQQVNTNNTVSNITNSNGTVNASNINGVINALDTQFRAFRDFSQKQQVRAMLFEDKVPGSRTFGAMCLGTMGFEIADGFKPGTAEWNWRTFGTGKGFTADLINAGTMIADRIKGGILSSKDDSLQIDLRESSKGLQLKKNGIKSIDISDHQMKFYDWDGIGAPIGTIYSGRRDGKESEPGLIIANNESSYLSLAYYDNSKGEYYSYMTLDKDNVTGECDIAPIRFKNNVDIRRVLYLENSRIFNSTDDYLVIDGKKALALKVNGENKIYAGTGVVVYDNFSVTGNKNCIQKTKDYGFRKFYSVEDAESYLTDRSMETFTVEKTKEGIYERVVLLDNVYKQSVNTNMNYTVEIIKQGWGDYRIKEQTPDYFIVESDREDFTFKYVITAHRKAYEDKRLEEEFDVNEEAFNKLKEERKAEQKRKMMREINIGRKISNE